MTPARSRLALVAFALSSMLAAPATIAQTPPPEMVRDVAETVYARALALERSGRMLEAEPHYQHAIDTDPGFLPPYLGYARALAHRGRRDDAVRVLLGVPRRAYAVDRDGVELARALAALGEIDGALERLRGFDSSPDALRVQIELASAHGRFPEALAAARRMAEQHADDRQPRVMVRALAQLVGDADAVRAAPTDASVLRRLLRD